MLNSLVYSLKRLLKKPFKVGIITYHYPGESAVNSGVGIHAYNISRELTNLGCEVYVYCHGSKNSVKREYIGEGKLTVRRIATHLNLQTGDNLLDKYISDFIFDNKTMEEIIKENNRENFDVIHSNGGLISGIFVSKSLGNIQWVNTIHSIEKRRLQFMSKEEKKHLNIFRWMESAITHADANIAVSQNLKQDILKDYPVKEGKVFYIPNGVDKEIFQPDNSIAEQKKVLYVGRFSLEKGIDYLPRIINNVLHHNKELKFEVIASDARVPESMQKTKNQFEVLLKKFPERFIWTKELLSKEQLAKKYNESMLIVQPSRYESFGMTVLEAMACGKAVVISDKGALSEVAGNAGITLPLNNASFSKQILKLVDDYKLRTRYGRRGLERSNQYLWREIAKHTLDLYKVLTKKKGPEEEGKAHEAMQALEELNKKEENDKS